MTPQELQLPTGTAAEVVAEAQNVSRDFRSGSGVVHALRGVSLVIRAGELVALRGRSGSGKTTLLNILTGLDNPTSGSVTVLGRPLAGMDEAARARLRREHVGMMFQNAHLFPLLTAAHATGVADARIRRPGAARASSRYGAFRRRAAARGAGAGAGAWAAFRRGG